MSTSLDINQKDFKQLLERCNEIVLNQFEALEEKPVYHAFPQKDVERWFQESLPTEGMPLEELMQEVQEKVMDTATNNLGPYMYAYVMAGGTQVSIIAETLAATINQNVGKWHLAPAINEIEKRVIQWGGEITGFGPSAAGVLVSGGSAANLAGLEVARNLYFEKEEIRKKGLFHLKPCTVYASSEVHGCVDKSIEELGIGTNQLRKIAVDENFKIDLTMLRKQIEEDIEAGYTPFCLIGNAGTVNTGAIDDLDALANIAAQYGMWYHIDGAYGGLLGSLPSLQEKYKGIERADSLAVDFHKWLYQTFEGGCVLVRDWDHLKKSYFKVASYLDTKMEEAGRINFNEHYFQLSRNAKALKIWMSLKAYGLKAIQKMMQKDLDLSDYLSTKIEENDAFELMTTSDLAISCFRYVKGLGSEEDIEVFNKRLIQELERDGKVFITGTIINGTFVIRACLINHRMNENTVSYLVDTIQEVAEKMEI